VILALGLLVGGVLVVGLLGGVPLMTLILQAVALVVGWLIIAAVVGVFRS